ncbi:hypothetical protein [Myxococcus stipitatus]|uniref:hypothetical protein n=1 Tax=Myxococcus stipitatus TaxID=83455 RepID=UPI00118717B3|nr:hypothetical protein [Myxococcus stipitatus]
MKTQEAQGTATTTPAKKDGFTDKKDPAAQSGKPQLASTLEHPTLALNKAGQKPSVPQRRNSVDMAKFLQGVDEIDRTLTHQTHVDPRPFIKEVCDSINKKVPDAKVLHYIDQGQNPIMANPEVQAAFSQGSQGVCSVMTSEWIRMNQATSNQSTAVENFSQLVEHKFGNLIIGQQSEAEALRQIHTLAAEVRTEVANFKALGAAQKKVISEKGAGSPEAQALETQLDASYKNAERLHQQQQDVHDRLGRGTLVQMGAASDLGDFLASTTLANGYYRLGLTPKNGSSADGDDSGHVVGMHKTDTTCRFMDANTGEWEVSNPADLNKLATEHVKQMYTSSFWKSAPSGFSAGNFQLHLVPPPPPPPTAP